MYIIIYVIIYIIIYIYIMQKYLTTFHCISLYPFVFPFCWLNHPFSASFKHLNFTYNFTYQLYDVSKANETLHLQWKHYAQQGKTSFEGGKNLPSTKQAKWIKMDGMFLVYTCSHHQNSNENRCLWMTMDDYGWWVVYGWLWMLMVVHCFTTITLYTGYPHGDAAALDAAATAAAA